MELINANELISAGVSFTIEDEHNERSFDDKTGELRGVRHEMPREYFAFDLSPEVDELGAVLIDTMELSDDNDRWSHLADSHVLERDMKVALYLSLNTDGRDGREYLYLAEQRTSRYERLLDYTETCSSRQLRKLRAGVWARTCASRRACAQTGDWSTVYLTKEQVNHIMSVINDRL